MKRRGILFLLLIFLMFGFLYGFHLMFKVNTFKTPQNIVDPNSRDNAAILNGVNRNKVGMISISGTVTKRPYNKNQKTYVDISTSIDGAEKKFSVYYNSLYNEIAALYLINGVYDTSTQVWKIIPIKEVNSHLTKGTQVIIDIETNSEYDLVNTTEIGPISRIQLPIYNAQ